MFRADDAEVSAVKRQNAGNAKALSDGGDGCVYKIDTRIDVLLEQFGAALQVFLRGELDIMAFMPDQWVHTASTPEFEAKYKKLTYYTPRHGYIGWNMRKPCFSDKRVRQAMTMLLDRELILETILQGLGLAVTNSFFIDSVEYNKEIEPWPFDPGRAKALLDEAGWVDSDGKIRAERTPTWYREGSYDLL